MPMSKQRRGAVSVPPWSSLAKLGGHEFGSKFRLHEQVGKCRVGRIDCGDPQKIGSAAGYEVNIYDKRPDPTFGTGAIVNVAKASPMLKAGGQWNTLEITAKGPQLSATLNGTRTAEGQDGNYASGRIALQYSAGVVKFRKMQIKPL